MKKNCPKCGLVKKLTEFGKNRSTKNGLNCWCKNCVRISSKKTYIKTSTTSKRDYLLKKRFNITLREYEQMALSQNNVCAICGKPETSIHKRNGKIKRLSVDHDHKTGKVRGLLCAGCNLVLGMIEKNPTVLRSVINYLGRSLKI